jgi:hypothetical protein
VLVQPGGTAAPISLSYAGFVKQDALLSNRLLSAYARRLRDLYLRIETNTADLGYRQQTMLLGVLFLSVLLLSIPMAYGLNDRGWGFAGLAGILLIVVLVPVAYSLLLSAAERLRAGESMSGVYPLLFPAVAGTLLGIVLDVVIAVRGASR